MTRERSDLVVPHMQVGAERVRQHEYGRALRSFHLGMDHAAVGIDVGHEFSSLCKVVASWRSRASGSPDDKLRETTKPATSSCFLDCLVAPHLATASWRFVSAWARPSNNGLSYGAVRH